MYIHQYHLLTSRWLAPFLPGPPLVEVCLQILYCACAAYLSGFASLFIYLFLSSQNNSQGSWTVVARHQGMYILWVCTSPLGTTGPSGHVPQATSHHVWPQQSWQEFWWGKGFALAKSYTLWLTSSITHTLAKLYCVTWAQDQTQAPGIVRWQHYLLHRAALTVKYTRYIRGKIKK